VQLRGRGTELEKAMSDFKNLDANRQIQPWPLQLKLVLIQHYCRIWNVLQAKKASHLMKWAYRRKWTNQKYFYVGVDICLSILFFVNFYFTPNKQKCNECKILGNLEWISCCLLRLRSCASLTRSHAWQQCIFLELKLL
jgi:hypothetical protein